MFIKRRLYIVLIFIVICFAVGYVSIFMFTLAQLFLLGAIILCAYELFLLYFAKEKPIDCWRECSERFSNGDENEVKLHLSNSYPFFVKLEIIDELPPIFQMRHLLFEVEMKKKEDKTFKYHIRPTKRGVYEFGNINVFASTKIGFISRRFKTGQTCKVKVYPSYLLLKQYELIASSNKLVQHGNKRVQKIGQQLEPDQIKEYIKDDDYRFINWKATARRSKLMTNVFRDERDQNIYCLIDKGRTMQSAFEGMTLLDYSINAALALSYVAILKGDKAGLTTFERKVDTMVAATRNSTQMQKIQETLYHQTTAFNESDFESLYQAANKHIKNRSLFLIYTNFDSVQAMQRQLRYLSMLAKKHCVLVIFFENTELAEIANRPTKNKTEVYEAVVAEKLEHEKALIIHKLRQYNILSLLTHPENLTVDVINRYLDIKMREI